MKRFQFTPQDYLTYLQMSNHEHVLVEDDARKRAIEELLGASHPGSYANLDVDDAEYLVYFEYPYSNEEKVGHIFSNAIRCPYAHKLVSVITGPNTLTKVVPINDTLSVTQRAEGVLKRIESKEINAIHLPEVRRYLLQHLDLIDLLPFVARITSEAFGNEAKLTLELYRDPEVQDSYLAIFGRSHNYDEGFLETIKRIRAGYTDLLTGKSGWILVTTDFDVPNPG